ncbi:MAG: hypothetical protein U9N52_07205 [Campylobacterota bacterium]|nr:hypothetical protein [Campylobacterota bacterium]
MARIDEIKEHIGALKSYLNILVAIILTLGAGVSKLYISDSIMIIFWIGILLIGILLVLFILISRSIHLNIKKLKDL